MSRETEEPNLISCEIAISSIRMARAPHQVMYYYLIGRKGNQNHFKYLINKYLLFLINKNC